jgi:hypothetical protein
MITETTIINFIQLIKQTENYKIICPLKIDKYVYFLLYMFHINFINFPVYNLIKVPNDCTCNEDQVCDAGTCSNKGKGK